MGSLQWDAALAVTESRLRLYVRPWFGEKAINRIDPADLRRWQAHLAGSTGYATVMRCRSLVLRILQFAVDEGAIDTNPSARCPRPDGAPTPSRSWTVSSAGPSPRGSRSPAGPVPAVLVGPRAGSARHRAAVRGAGRAAPPPRPPRPPSARPPGRRHPLSGGPVRQRLQAPPEERRRHPRASPGPAGGRGHPPVTAWQRPVGPGVHRPRRRPRPPPAGPGCQRAPGPCCRAPTSTAPTRPRWPS